MAVSITVAELAAAIRLGSSTEETAQATRLLALATQVVTKHAANAPDAVQNEAAIRVAGYLFDAPQAAQGAGYADILRNSGAAALLLPYRVHRAGSTKAAIAAAQSVASPDNPVTNVSVAGGLLTVTFADATTQTYQLPAGGVGGADQTARDAAAAAQVTADAATTPDEAEALIAPFARNANPSGHITPDLVGANPADDQVALVTGSGAGSSFRFVDPAQVPGLPVPAAWAQQGASDPTPVAVNAQLAAQNAQVAADAADVRAIAASTSAGAAGVRANTAHQRLDRVQDGAQPSALRDFPQAEIDAISNGESQDFALLATVAKAADGTLSYTSGWRTDVAVDAVARYDIQFDAATYTYLQPSSGGFDPGGSSSMTAATTRLGLRRPSCGRSSAQASSRPTPTIRYLAPRRVVTDFNGHLS